MADQTHQVSTADQDAAALYAKQYQQYAQEYQAWLAANPGYQQPPPPGVAPPPTAAPDYSAYYQQYQQPQPQPQPQPLTPEQQYAQQYAAYYAQYGYAVPPSSPASAPAPLAAPATPAAAPGLASYSHPGYQAYYPQQSQPQPHPSYQHPVYQPTAQATQPPPQAPGPALTSYPYTYQAQPRPPPQQPSSYSVHQERASAVEPQTNKVDQERQYIQHRLQETHLNGSGPSTGENSVTQTRAEKPAYLSVKSKKVKPLTTNVLESRGPQSPAAVPKENWPDSLKAYVQRVFETVDDVDRDAAQAELKSLVARHLSNGTLWEVDWDKTPVSSKYAKKKGANGTNGSSEKRSRSPPAQDLTMGAEERERREKRMRRFEDQLSDKPPVKKPLRVEYALPVNNGDVIDWDKYTIVGTSKALEKNYLRLTSAPDPATVRPVHVLQKTLELLKDKWRRDQNYAYICDQFKSVRQDLTVQRIKNEFTVTVYEIHARIALEKGDLGEYNQCQTQLKQLYGYNLRGHVMEFTAYRILYLLHTRNPSDIIAMLASLTPSQKQDPAVRHALQVRTALASSNYHVFFKLYINAPNMGGYLMDQFVERERVEAMKTICKAYRPSIEVSFLVSTLGFADEVECFDFLKAIGVLRFLNQDEDKAKGRKQHQHLDTKMALLTVLEAGKKYQMIDIKGQI
ncbi:hypothetical protein KVV02_003441 [Mortierella alpina]|uniref:PCI domain-containing protein n=1 Tax=Mortierella alpina TaxID=64518 RepID=A0A9P8CXZ5_MORAP|nr:hypothetical protein KVV02_003441 [Mortierella alpina]